MRGSFLGQFLTGGNQVATGCHRTSEAIVANFGLKSGKIFKF